MSLTGSHFFLFAVLVVLLYYILPKKCQWLVLLAASLVFYITYGWEKLPFLVVSAAIAWFAGRKMETIQQTADDPAEGKRRCKQVLLTAVALLVALLAYAKAGQAVMAAITELLHAQQLSSVHVIVALGVSYYTFSLISYLADIYRRQDKTEHSFLRLLLFTCYFPKVLQGPISRHKNLAPQLMERHCFDYKEFCFSLQLMVWGCFKKMVIADRLWR